MSQYRKVLSDRELNAINYMMMSDFTYKPGYQLLGLIPIRHQGWWGVEINGMSYTAAHLFQEPEPRGDDHRETSELARLNPWIVFFTGSDDTSFFKRFESKNQALSWFRGLTALDQVAEDCFWFN